VSITNDFAKPVQAAKVTVRIEYQDSKGNWVTDQTVTLDTDTSGNVTFTPKSTYGTATNTNFTYATNIRFTITKVEATGLSWKDSNTVVSAKNPG